MWWGMWIVAVLAIVMPFVVFLVGSVYFVVRRIKQTQEDGEW